jgi:hypothetical protein
MKRLGLILLLVLAPSLACAQGAILQGGPWTAGHAPMYVGQGSGQAVVQDSGPAGGGAAGYGMGEGLYVARGTGTAPYSGQGSGPFGTNWCNYDAPISNPTGYHYFCISPNATGPGGLGGQVIYGAGGGAAQLPLWLCANGICSTPGGQVANLSITRAQIPTTNITSNYFAVTGYRTSDDLGAACTYTSVGATSTGLMAIESANGVWFNLLLNGHSNPGCFGAYADNGAHTISSSDITANPQWRGTYSAGQTWDYVATQEAIYAALAANSTPGTIVWNNAGGAGIDANAQLDVSPGKYGINAELLAVGQGIQLNFASRQSTLWNWVGSSPGTLVLFNSFSYFRLVNFSAACGVAQSYGSQVPCVSFDHTGSSPGGLKTQQGTLDSPFIEVGINGQGIAVNAVDQSSGQGDTINITNPIFIGVYGDWALQLNGDNTLQWTILNGDCQGFPHNCIQLNGGSIQTYGTHFENETINNIGNTAPLLNQINTNGSDVAINGGVSTENIGIHYARSEGDILNFTLSGGALIEIDNAVITNTDATNWFASYGGYQPGTAVSGGTKGRVFMLVDNGGACEQFCAITSGTTNTITDSSASYSTNAYAGYDLNLRFGSNGNFSRCSIISNTATTITFSGCSYSTQSMYQISGITGSSAPSWDSAATGYSTLNIGAPGYGFTTTANSNKIGVDSGTYTEISTNDYIIIPYASQIAPGGSAPVFPMALYTKVTAKTGSSCPGMTQPDCLTVSLPALTAVTDQFGYGCTPVSDSGTGTLQWCNIPYDSIVFASQITNVRGIQLVRGQYGQMMGIQANRTDWMDQTPDDANLSPNASSGVLPANFDYGPRNSVCATVTWSSAVAVSAASNCLAVTPTSSATLNFAAPPNANSIPQTQQLVLMLTTSGTNSYTLTCGSNVTCNGTLSTGSISGATIAWMFQSIGGVWQEVTRSVSVCVLATSSTSGCVQPDNSTIGIAAGVISTIGGSPLPGNAKSTGSPYTSLASDLPKCIDVTTGSSADYTVTLISAATAGAGARQCIAKVDTGTNKVIVTDGSTTWAWLSNQNDTVTMRVNDAGNAWTVGTYNLSPRADIWTSHGSYTWTKPPLAKLITVLVVGSGSGGGSGARQASGSGSVSTGGAGGGAGAISYLYNVLASAFSSTEAVVVGAGGAGGAAVTSDNNNGNAGSVGAASSFGSLSVVAQSGAAGGGATNGTTATGGTAGVGRTNGGAGGNVANIGPATLGAAGFGVPAAGGGAIQQASGSFASSNGAASAQTASGYAGDTPGAGGIGSSKTSPTAGVGLIWDTGLQLGNSGGGGWAASDGTASAGANGACPGGAGGGGGSSGSGNNSGAGGSGCDGAVQVVTKFNFLLKRDLDPAANDDVPMWLEAAA